MSDEIQDRPLTRQKLREDRAFFNGYLCGFFYCAVLVALAYFFLHHFGSIMCQVR